ncbi:MAG TPA: AEC family transporter [Opitutaceae bacterium]|nr:AEC family transporter [Opitutaceae bacterium]
MPGYLQLLLLILPVFALVAIGVVIRRVHWIEGEAETSLIRLVVNLCYPCLIFESVVGNNALREPANLLLPPLVGFALTAGNILLCFYLARKFLGLTVGSGLRTFALATGICNYGYLPLPITAAIWGRDTQGVLMVHNVGAEAAVWTVGVLVLSGLSLREGWRRLLNPIVLTLVAAVAINLTGLAASIPRVVLDVVHTLAACMIPLGLLMVGVTLANYLNGFADLFRPKVSLGSAVLRLGLLPALILLLARWLPCPVEFKRVLVMQAAMPSGVFPIVLARHYGGQPLTAVQIVLGTTALGILTIPLWIRVGLAWTGAS